MPENVFQELVKCQNDFVYFVTNYVKIIHPKRGLIPLEVYSYQKELFDIYEKHKHVAVIKFRQGGFSTFTVLYGLWKCMFHKDKRFLFLCKTQREAEHLGKIVDKVFNYFPDWFMPRMTKDTKNTKIFSAIGSEMWFGSVDSAIGKNPTHIMIDEAAFIPNMDEKWRQTYPVLSDTKIFAVSTTNGIGNWFEEICTGSREGRNNFYLYHANYKLNPEWNNEKWAEEMRANLGEKSWQQEVLGNFVIDEPFPGFDFSKLTSLELATKLGLISCRKRLELEDRALIYEAAFRIGVSNAPRN